MAKGSIEWELDKEKGLTLHISPVPVCLENEEFRRHAMSAGRETLLALRSLIDAITRTAGEKERGDNQGGTRIKVE